MASAFQEA